MVEEERPITYGIVKPGHGCPGGVPVVKVKDMQDGAIDESNLLLTTPELDYQYRRSRLRTGDLLISIRGSVGRLAEIPESLENANITQDTARLTISPQYNKIYVRGVLESPILQWDMEKNIRGVAVKGINIGYLRELKMPVCSRERQDELAMLYQQSDKSKFNSFKSQFIEMFKNGNYPLVKAEEVCEFITKGTTPKSDEIYTKAFDDCIPYLKVYNLSFTGEMLFWDEPQYIRREIHEGKLARSKVYPGDVLMNIVGPPLGKFALVNDDFKEWNINQAIVIFRSKKMVKPKFLLHALLQPDVLGPFLEQAKGVRQLNFSLEQCRNLQFPLPPLDEQKVFVDFAEQSDKSK